jgi:hypothetical protein
MYTSRGIHGDFQSGDWTSLHYIAKVNNPSKFLYGLGCIDHRSGAWLGISSYLQSRICNVYIKGCISVFSDVWLNKYGGSYEWLDTLGNCVPIWGIWCHGLSSWVNIWHYFWPHNTFVHIKGCISAFSNLWLDKYGGSYECSQVWTQSEVFLVGRLRSWAHKWPYFWCCTHNIHIKAYPPHFSEVDLDEYWESYLDGALRHFEPKPSPHA